MSPTGHELKFGGINRVSILIEGGSNFMAGLKLSDILTDVSQLHFQTSLLFIRRMTIKLKSFDMLLTSEK